MVVNAKTIPHGFFFFSLWSKRSLEQPSLRTKAKRLKWKVQISTENQECSLKGLVEFSPNVLVKDCNLIYKSERANWGVILLFEWVGVSPYLLWCCNCQNTPESTLGSQQWSFQVLASFLQWGIEPQPPSAWGTCETLGTPMAPASLVSVSGGRSCHLKEQCFHGESTFICYILRVIGNVIAGKLLCPQIGVIKLVAICCFISDCAGVK